MATRYQARLLNTRLYLAKRAWEDAMEVYARSAFTLFFPAPGAGWTQSWGARNRELHNENRQRTFAEKTQAKLNYVKALAAYQAVTANRTSLRKPETPWLEFPWRPVMMCER